MQPTPSTPGSTPSPTLLTDLRAEVGAESAPLLRFILKHAGLIACGVGLLVLVLVGAGIWSWRNESAREEAQAELARLSLTLKGEERTRALGELAGRAPADVRFAVLAAQAQSAAESQDWTLAARLYGEAARLDSEGSLGQAALLAQCSALMNAGTPESASEALAVLQALTGRVEAARQGALLRMQAEAALAAGRTEVAAAAFDKLAEGGDKDDQAYYRYRAAQLRGAGDGAAAGEPQAPAADAAEKPAD